jgi:hypothetical protein
MFTRGRRADQRSAARQRTARLSALLSVFVAAGFIACKMLSVSRNALGASLCNPNERVEHLGAPENMTARNRLKQFSRRCYHFDGML